MTLTVRLDDALESALVRYCAQRGVTKSLVVQESLARYLSTDQAQGASAAPANARRPPVSVGATYRAFADAGFIGAGLLGGPSATKSVVRERAMQRISRNTK